MIVLLRITVCEMVENAGGDVKACEDDNEFEFIRASITAMVVVIVVLLAVFGRRRLRQEHCVALLNSFFILILVSEQSCNIIGVQSNTLNFYVRSEQ